MGELSLAFSDFPERSRTNEKRWFFYIIKGVGRERVAAGLTWIFCLFAHWPKKSVLVGFWPLSSFSFLPFCQVENSQGTLLFGKNKGFCKLGIVDRR